MQISLGVDVPLGEVVLGWLLGILSTPVVLWINTSFEKRRFLSALKEELTETKYRLILRISILRRQLGIMDRKSLEWVVLGIESCHRLDEEKKDFLYRQKKILELSDMQLSTALGKYYEAGTAIGPISTPYLNAKMDSIGLLSGVSQMTLVNFLFNMDNLNKKAEENSHWTTVSFSSSEKGQEIVAKNINFSVTAWISSAENAVECINRFMKSVG